MKKLIIFFLLLALSFPVPVFADTVVYGTNISETGNKSFLSSDVTIGSTIGSNLVSNGTFTTDLTGWAGANWAWNAGAGNGMALHTVGATTALTQAGLAGVVNTRYKLSITTRSLTAGSITFGIGGQVSPSITTNTTTTLYLTATTTGVLTITPSTDFDGGVDDITVQVLANGSLAIDKDFTMYSGQMLLGPGSKTYPAIASIYDPDTGIFFHNNVLNSVFLTAGGNTVLRVTSGSAAYLTTLAFGSAADAVADGYITREAASVLGAHNSTTAMTLNLYTTRTTYGSNYEMFQILPAAGSVTLQALSAGATGSANIDILINPKGTGLVKIAGLAVSADVAGVASHNTLTNAVNTTLTNTYVVKGGQAASTINTGWMKVYIGTAAAWIPYWSNATP